MKKGASILYVQHAAAIGGSVISLKEVVTDALAKGYKCSVICPSDAVADFYTSLGAKTYKAWVIPFNHNTAYSYKFSPREGLRIIKVLLNTLISFFQFIKIIRESKPDIAHINSSALFLYNPYFWLWRIPVVFHVREYVVNGYTGFRKSIIRWTANTFARFIIFISEHEYELLKTKKEKSFVIYNYVHLDAFVKRVKTTTAPGDKLKLITMGGLYHLKGGDVILESLRSVKSNVELTVLGGEDPFTNLQALSYIDGNVYASRIMELLRDEKIGSRAKIVGKVEDPAPYLAQVDALIFWARAPHFPRPVFESWLLRKPVVYFNPEFHNNIIDKGNIVAVGDPSAQALAAAIDSLASSGHMTEEKTQSSYIVAVENFTERNFEKVDALYKKLLSHGETAGA